MLRYNTEKDGHKKSGGRVNANLYCSGVCLSQREIKPLERMEWLQSLTVSNLEFQAMHNHFKVRVSYLWRENVFKTQTFYKFLRTILSLLEKKSEPITSGSL
jgi:hypothetical protein